LFENIIGNKKNKEILKKAIEINKTSHSYIFCGTEGIGKKLIAKELAKKILCLKEKANDCDCKSCIEFDSDNNPDFQLIESVDGKIKIEQIRQMQRKVAEKLGLELYDRDLIDRAAEKIVAMPKDVLEKADEKKRNPWLHEVWYDVPNQELNGMTANDALHLAYNSIIRELAEKGDCVFVGRCADYILRDAQPFRIFVYADTASKLKRCMERKPENENLTEPQMKKKMVEIDRNRANYYDYFSEQKWGAKENYDLLVNTSNVDIKTLSFALCEYLQKHI